jgi:hypothetical protein
LEGADSSAGSTPNAKRRGLAALHTLPRPGHLTFMPKLNIQRTRDLLQKFDFRAVFIEELGWSHAGKARPVSWQVNGVQGTRVMIAELAGVAVFEVTAAGGGIPDAATCRALANEVSRQHYENLLIFTDAARTQSLWLYVKREGGKAYPREHWYFKGQPGDLFLSKLSGMVVDLGEFDAAGNIEVTKVARKLKDALDVERVTKKFFGEFYTEHIRFVEMIEGIADERDRRWYASVLLNRLMFIYFLQAKHFINRGETKYLQRNLDESRGRGADRYYAEFLKALFFEGFAKPEEQRSAAARALLGEIKYLNGGLFLEHRIEAANPGIRIPDAAFENLFALFDRYSWNLNDTPGGSDDEISPDVLGYIFEKYINQKAFGAYYTRPEITEYLCEQTIHRLVLARVNERAMPLAGHSQASLFPGERNQLFFERQYDSVADLFSNLDAQLCRFLLHEVLPELSILDPACGSGAFLVAAMRTLINLYAAVIGKIKALNDTNLTHWLKGVEREHPNVGYFIKKRIITDNLFGVDVMEEATEIAKLRLFLALVASAEAGRPEQLEPLPNIDFNILAGNSLIGLMRVDDDEFNRRQSNLFIKPYRQLLAEKNRLIDNYRHASAYGEDLRRMRDDIARLKADATATLDELLHEEFKRLKIQFEQAAWDEKKDAEGKPQKRPVRLADIGALRPFHWGYEFDEIINRRGGFDVILTNPPWEIFKPQAKEFFAEHSDLVTKNKMTIKEFEKEQAKLLKKPEIRKAWLAYRSRFPHVNLFFRHAPQYRNQESTVNGKKQTTDLNLYKLFVEQCFNLLRAGGECGIVIPSGIYTDLGAKQLREMLFERTKITGLFCFENRKLIFEGVDSRFKFVVLTFCKEGATTAFPSAFMRHEVSELETFPQSGSLPISVELVRRLSPDSLSVMEFKNELDIRIAEQMLRFPLLGEQLEGKWNLELCREFHMTDDSHLYKTSPGKARLPLYEGKMIHQFTHRWGEAKYWLDEKQAREELRAARRKEIMQLARKANLDWDDGEAIELDYKSYRFAFRDVARNTDERTMIATILPPNLFCPHTMSLEQVYAARLETGESGKVSLRPNWQAMNNPARLYLCAVMNSFVVDAWLRRGVTAHLSFFFVNGVPIPRLTEQDKEFAPIVERAAKLICTTPEFDDLAEEVGLGSHRSGVTDEAGRAQLRAELDGIIAHLYGLSEEEFAYILTTFPLVSETVKTASQNAYRDVERGLIK